MLIRNRRYHDALNYLAIAAALLLIMLMGFERERFTHLAGGAAAQHDQMSINTTGERNCMDVTDAMLDLGLLLLNR